MLKLLHDACVKVNKTEIRNGKLRGEMRGALFVNINKLHFCMSSFDIDSSLLHLINLEKRKLNFNLNRRGTKERR